MTDVIIFDGKAARPVCFQSGNDKQLKGQMLFGNETVPCTAFYNDFQNRLLEINPLEDTFKKVYLVNQQLDISGAKLQITTLVPGEGLANSVIDVTQEMAGAINTATQTSGTTFRTQKISYVYNGQIHEIQVNYHVTNKWIDRLELHPTLTKSTYATGDAVTTAKVGFYVYFQDGTSTTAIVTSTGIDLTSPNRFHTETPTGSGGRYATVTYVYCGIVCTYNWQYFVN